MVWRHAPTSYTYIPFSGATLKPTCVYSNKGPSNHTEKLLFFGLPMVVWVWPPIRKIATPEQKDKRPNLEMIMIMMRTTTAYIYQQHQFIPTECDVSIYERLWYDDITEWHTEREKLSTPRPRRTSTNHKILPASCRAITSSGVCVPRLSETIINIINIAR